MSGQFFKLFAVFSLAQTHNLARRLSKYVSIALACLALWGMIVNPALSTPHSKDKGIEKQKGGGTQTVAKPLDLDLTLQKMEDLVPDTRFKGAKSLLTELQTNYSQVAEAQQQLRTAQHLYNDAEKSLGIADDTLSTVQKNSGGNKNYPVTQDQYNLASDANIKVTRLEAALNELKSFKQKIAKKQDTYTLKQFEDRVPETRFNTAQDQLRDLEKQLWSSAEARQSLVNAQELINAAQNALNIAQDELRTVQQNSNGDKNYQVTQKQYDLAIDADSEVKQLEAALDGLKSFRQKPDPAPGFYTFKQFQDLMSETRFNNAKLLLTQLQNKISDVTEAQEPLSNAKRFLAEAEEALGKARAVYNTAKSNSGGNNNYQFSQDQLNLANEANSKVKKVEDALEGLKKIKENHGTVDNKSNGDHGHEIDWPGTLLLILSISCFLGLAIFRFFYYKPFNKRHNQTDDTPPYLRQLSGALFFVDKYRLQGVLGLMYSNILTETNKKITQKNDKYTSDIEALREKVETLYEIYDDLIKKQNIPPKRIELQTPPFNFAKTQQPMSTKEPKPKKVVGQDEEIIIRRLILEIIERKSTDCVIGSDLCSHILEALAKEFPNHEIGECKTYDFSFNKVDKGWFYLLFTYPLQGKSELRDGLLFVAPGVSTNPRLGSYFTGVSPKKSNIEKVSKPAKVKVDQTGLPTETLEQGEVK